MCPGNYKFKKKKRLKIPLLKKKAALYSQTQNQSWRIQVKAKIKGKSYGAFRVPHFHEHKLKMFIVSTASTQNIKHECLHKKVDFKYVNRAAEC